MEFPSKLISNAVEEFSRLPGIGKKTALRLVLHLLKETPEDVRIFSDTIYKMRKQIKYCKQCHNVADSDTCNICESRTRNQQQVCVVENMRDVLAIENTQHYNGVFHVLGGVISPLEGIGPDKLNITSLLERIEKKGVTELIMALSPTMEGDTTVFYLSKKLAEKPVTITTLARGVAFGGELQYVDEVTLARSIATRRPYENYLVKKD